MNKIQRILKILHLTLYAESNRHYKGYVSLNSRAYKCRVSGCINKAYAKGLCNAHYIRKRKDKPFDLPIRCRIQSYRICPCGKTIGRTGAWYLCHACYKRRRRDVIKRALVEFLGGICKKCKEKFPHYVFDFHHIKGKDFGIGNMLELASLYKLAKEVSKCVLLCANCHREETYGRL